FPSRVLVSTMVRHLPAQFPGVVPRPFGLAGPLANNRFFTPLFSTFSELLFSQLLSFHNHLRCPLLFSSVRSIPAASVRSGVISFFKSFVIRRLPPLRLSCLSFSHSFPLF